MRYVILFLCLSALPVFSANADLVSFLTGKKVIGWAEKVYVYDSNMMMKARLDTGALLSSVHSNTIKIIDGKKKSDSKRVIFEIINEDGEKQKLERPLVRWANIKKKGTAGWITRPVVHLKMCIADRITEGEVTLANRSRFIYPLLIGRNILKQEKMIVDSEDRYTHSAECKK